tara:strand:+ start:541 stop:705 length:165 start_codon:yes stop_codon:yes gene_type:complete
MAIINPPITKDTSVDLTLLEIINQFNLLEQKHLKLLKDIRAATDLADLKIRINL